MSCRTAARTRVIGVTGINVTRMIGIGTGIGHTIEAVTDIDEQ